MIAKDKVRYLVEHRLVPFYTYQSGLALSFALMAAPQDTMRQLFQRASSLMDDKLYMVDNGIEGSCKSYEKDGDRLLIVRVGMPVPREPLQCRALYICFSKTEGKRLCFTSELNSDGSHYLCAWTQDEVHLNFGEAPETVHDEMERIASLFWEVKQNGYKKMLEDLRAG